MLITISGAIGSGKDTFANMLQDKLEANGHEVQQVKFADPLRQVAFNLGFNPDDRKTKELKRDIRFTANQLSDEIFRAMKYMDPMERRVVACRVWMNLVQEHSTISVEGHRRIMVSCRELMIAVGMYVRAHQEDYFIQHLQHEIADSEAGFFICSDCRFPNELVGRWHVHVNRANNPFDTGSKAVSESHRAVLMERADIILDNDESLVELEEEAFLVAVLVG